MCYISTEGGSGLMHNSTGMVHNEDINLTFNKIQHCFKGLSINNVSLILVISDPPPPSMLTLLINETFEYSHKLIGILLPSKSGRGVARSYISD
jgi:hypothetical protein